MINWSRENKGKEETDSEGGERQKKCRYASEEREIGNTEGNRKSLDLTFLTINESGHTWKQETEAGASGRIQLITIKRRDRHYPTRNFKLTWATTERKHDNSNYKMTDKKIQKANNKTKFITKSPNSVCWCVFYVLLTRLAAPPLPWPCPSPCLYTAPRWSSSSGPLHQLGTIRRGRMRLGRREWKI